METSGPDMALGAAVLSVALSWTYFFSPQALLAAGLALPLGLMSRSHERSRGMGTTASVLAAIAVVVAGATLIST